LRFFSENSVLTDAARFLEKRLRAALCLRTFAAFIKPSDTAFSFAIAKREDL
jgi:hypothetical protein